MLYLYLLLALLLQTICSLGFASASYAHGNAPIKKAVLICGSLTFLLTIFAYSMIWLNHSWIIPYSSLSNKSGDTAPWITINIFWLSFSHFILWIWSLAMFNGAIILSSVRIENGKIKINPESILALIIDKTPGIVITKQTNICNLSWSLAAAFVTIPIALIMIIGLGLTYLIIGLICWLFLGITPLFIIWDMLSKKERIRYYYIGKFRLVPIVPIILVCGIWYSSKLPVITTMIGLGVMIASGLAIFLLIWLIKKIIRWRQALAQEPKPAPTPSQEPERQRVEKPCKPKKPAITRPSLIQSFWSVLKGKACLKVEYED